MGNAPSGESDKTFSVTVPDGKNLLFHEASVKEIDKAVTLAHQAFARYRHFTGEQKASFLEKIAELIASSKDALVKMAMHETHLAQGRLEGEVGRTINQLKLFAQQQREGSWVHAMIDTALPDRKPLPKPDVRQLQLPLGVAAVFGASNFPFAFSVAGGDTVSALAAGCPVVHKAHPGHPATCEMVATLIIQAAKECSVPEGIFSLLQGISYTISTELITHPLIKAVGFTGSFSGGKALFDAASKREEPIPVYAEMGSTNPVFILPGILKEQASVVAEKLSMSNVLSAGQFCTNPGIIVLSKSQDAENFISHFSDQIKNVSADSMLTKNIYSAYQTAIKKLETAPHVTAISKGKESSTEGQGSATTFQTTAKAFLANKDLQHEVFGPSSIHVVADHKDELIALAKNLTGQLTASVWGTEADLIEYKDLIQELELKVGRVIFNNVPTGVEVTHAMVHGGPFPATTDSKTTSVGSNATYRFTRAVCYQNCPQPLLPDALKNNNPLNLWRVINGEYSKDSI